jgi:peptide-methionine (S)-S-oxide reductase
LAVAKCCKKNHLNIDVSHTCYDICMANKTIYVAGGCFWGLQELFREQPGIVITEVGYTGGSNDNPDYSNHPGHAEALAVTYDTDKTTYAAILDYFFRIHDPTTLNQQGNDKGSSYRSAIFYQDQDELAKAQELIAMVNESGMYKQPVVTSLEAFTKFYSAEDYHQDYLQKNPGGYTCHFVRSDQSLLPS